MKYFRERHNLKTDYSGYQEVSNSLRNRLNTVCQRYIAHGMIGVGQEDWWIPISVLEDELSVNLEEKHIGYIISNESYEYVFEAIEIFLDVAEEYASRRYASQILPDIKRTFDLSGSVYYISNDGEIALRTDERLAKNLKEIETVLSDYEKSYKMFFETVGNLMSRKDKPKNIVKDIFIAFENYLKEATKEKDFGKAINYLKNQGILTSPQKSLIEKIYAYRSDAFAVGHAGGSQEPDEIDALWFLETTIAQLKFLDRKFKQVENTSFIEES